MRPLPSWPLAACLLLIAPTASYAQASHGYQTDFSRDELTARRTQVLDAIGPQGIAIIQGAAGVPGFSVFRQSNDFYYLSGVESAQAYLLLHGRTRRSTLYLPHRDEGREQGGARSCRSRTASCWSSSRASTRCGASSGCRRTW